jgi:hypothetical protein
MGRLGRILAFVEQQIIELAAHFLDAGLRLQSLAPAGFF